MSLEQIGHDAFRPGDDILLIDDDEDSRLIYSSALESAGYHVRLASDGEQGIRLARETTPRVILMDVLMPKIDGATAARTLKSDPATRDVPTIALTAAEALHNRGDLLAAGFDAVLLKPMSPSVVLVAVRQALTTPQTERSD